MDINYHECQTCGYTFHKKVVCYPNFGGHLSKVPKKVCREMGWHIPLTHYVCTSCGQIFIQTEEDFLLDRNNFSPYYT